MSHIEFDMSWLVRDSVEKNITEKVRPICNKLLELQIKPESDEAVEAIIEFVDFGDYTEDEFEWLLKMVISEYYLITLENKGLVKEVEPGTFEITQLGRQVYDLL